MLPIPYEFTMRTPLRALAMFLCLSAPLYSQDLNAKLIDASRTQDTAEVRKLLAQGADPNAKDKNGRTPLMEASSGGYTDTVRILLEKGADVNAMDAVGWSALFWASFSRRTDTVRFLLEKGANAKARDNEGRTALFWAASSGYADTVRALLVKGANVNAKDNHGWTALMSAANLGHLDTVRALLDYHADVRQRDKDGNTAQSLAEKYKNYGVASLLQNPAQATQSKPPDGSTKSGGQAAPSAGSSPAVAPASAPQAASKPGSEKAAAAVSPPASGATAPAVSNSELLNQKLLRAADAGDTVQALALIRDGAGVNTREATYGNTPLMHAAGRGYSDTVRALLEKGGEVNGTDNSGHTALMEAAFGGYTSTVSLLLEKGADVNARDIDGWTPLFWAVFSRRADTARLLLERGADVNARNKHEDTSLIHAAYGGDMDTLVVLLEHRPDLNLQNDMGRSALMEAVRQEHADAVHLLLERGGDANLQDRDGNTTLSLATKQSSSSIIALLKNPPTPTQPPVAGVAPATPPESHTASASNPDPLAAEVNAMQKKSRARTFYGLGLSMCFFEEWWPQSNQQAERAAAAVLGDLRKVGAPEDLIDAAQQAYVRLTSSPDDSKTPLQPMISMLRERLDTYGLAQPDEKFFYAAGRLTYEIDLLGRNLSNANHVEANTERTRVKLLSLVTNYAAQCALHPECKDRALSYFSDSGTLLQKTPLGPEDGTSLQNLADNLGVALGTEER